MKKFLSYILALSLLVISVSCDSDSDSDQGDSTLREKNIVVTGKSSDVIQGEPGDRYQYNGDGWRVIVTDATKIYIQRESCSGLTSAGAGDIRIGQTIFFKFQADQADYRGSPNIVRALVIESYRPECIGVSPNTPLLITTNTVTVITTNTSTTTTTTITTNIVRR